MSKTRYRYTILKRDGGLEYVGAFDKKLPLDRLQELVGGNLELIPPAYYEHNLWGRCTVYGDAEARFKEHRENLHFTMFPNGQFMPPVVNDCVRIDREVQR